MTSHNPLEGQACGDRIGGLSDGGYAPRVVEAAIHFTATSDAFADAVSRSIAFAGPSNYCPVLVGAFAAAHHGATAVPAYPAEATLRDPVQRVFAALTQTT